MVYILLYLLSLMICVPMYVFSTTAVGQFVGVAAQATIYAIMFMYWRQKYDAKGIKAQVIEQSELPITKRKTLVKSGNWGFLVLVYFVSQVMAETMITPVYYIATVLDFGLIFFTLYPLVIEANIGLKKAGLTKVVIVAFLVVVASLGFNYVYSVFVEYFNLAPNAGEVSVNQVEVVKMIVDNPVRSFLMITFSAAIVEEWLFRGLGFRTMIHRNRILAYVVTFIVFSLPHLLLGLAPAIRTGDFSEFVFMPIYGMMGVFFAVSYENTETIYTPMLAHFMNNTLSFVSILLSLGI